MKINRQSHIALKLLTVFALFLIYIPQISAAEETENYIVFLDSKYDSKSLADMGIEVVQHYENINAATINISDSQLPIIQSLGIINKASKENPVKVNAQVIPWGHTNINLDSKQPADLSGKNVKIAILDTGADINHPDLSIKKGFCALQNCPNSYRDDNGHGTHVAGVIAAKNNSIGIVGVAPDAEIYAVKALDSRGNGTTTTIMSGLDWAISQNVDIINMSLTTPYDDVGMKAMIDRAYQKGITVIAAAGNSGTRTGSEETVLYPAKFPNVIAVSGVNQSNNRVSSSSTGKEVELAAPGENIYSTYPTSLDSRGYAHMTGTSMAAPFVTGLAALYKEKFPYISNIKIRELLRKNAKDLGAPGRDPFYGYGLAQADTEVIQPLKVPYETSANGKISLNMQSVLDRYSSYNVYRFDQLIEENGTEPFLTDYGLKGNVEYMIFPLENGKERRDRAVKLNINLLSPTFYDISNSKWYSNYMIYLNSRGILFGYDGNQIRPDQLVKRSEAVAMLGRAKGLDETKRPTRFKDVGSNNFASGFIESAAEQGILKGFPDGTFRPDEPVTRAEMAILISKAYSLPNSQRVTFKDVNTNVTGYQSIYNLAASGITEGYLDGTFRPYEKMLRSTYSVFLAKAEGQ
jgi:subtilisin